MNNNPFVTHTYDTWKQFLTDNQYFADDMGFVFRGHASSNWELETTLDRLLTRLNPKGIDLDSTYDFLLKEFVHSIRARSGVKKDLNLNDEELWSIGQHYGLATPLLDWSRSLYVAVFFAFENSAVSDSGFRSIWALNICPFVLDKIKEFNDGKDKKYHFKVIDPISDENPRLIAQTGLFTRQPLKYSLVNWVRETLPNDSPYLIKINIPESERMSILKHLRIMNIHHGTLFPDIEGAAKYCNHTLEILSNKRVNGN
ncbi:FRG domain-containing protein [Pectobacterium parmentieri]|uniref:FRG domain-containing protein n=1 Tax=Pectobacterium parmentieri TaxID=1905730 RepID=UPI00137392AF|nr:FRG domain-containing protein [Pectobacterium parmentieri]QHQ17301.1 FRG domain-containing protein [Pectobacterium parmentieri]